MSVEKILKLKDNLIDLKLNIFDSEGNSIEVGFNFNNPATENEITYVENKLNFKFPKSFINFLETFNGCTLFNYKELDGLIILSTNDFIKINNYLINTFEEDWNSELIIFAKYIGEDNYLAFNGEKIIDCFTEELPSEWRIISNDFNQFIDEFIENDGAKYWL
ncbi:SMI1/KNR4 family protein [Clostridium taeniosporum]|uniref:SMI1/KNR4 family protein n=1 Tax=Clostridium taeniosporum TaxID=394958 RepID=A0A1D7XGI3_9CLOT|nr:SMI1/KNR4 family protein [Clostridium taeniosporum]AOR22468.1 SMI1/KNR4 family protein [Clostridium taeniosporum]